MQNREDITMISNMVKKHLTSILGSSTVQVIDAWLKQRGCRGIEDICVDPEKVRLHLYIIFKDAALLLENEIIRALEYNINNNEENELVKDIVARLRACSSNKR